MEESHWDAGGMLDGAPTLEGLGISWQLLHAVLNISLTMQLDINDILSACGLDQRRGQ